MRHKQLHSLWQQTLGESRFDLGSISNLYRRFYDFKNGSLNSNQNFKSFFSILSLFRLGVNFNSKPFFEKKN